jgi:hypothetical protein
MEYIDIIESTPRNTAAVAFAALPLILIRHMIVSRHPTILLTIWKPMNGNPRSG